MKEEEKEIRLTDLDYLLAEPRLQMIKAAIPYMQVSQQRALSLFVKLQELNRTRQLFQDGDLSAMGLSAMGLSGGGTGGFGGDPGTQRNSPAEMLQAMKPFAGPRERDMIEMMENIQIMMQAMHSA